MNKKKSKKILHKALIGIAIFGAGMTLGKLFDWGYFTLSSEISISDALTMFITIGVAIYIANVLERDIQDNRNEKDLLLKRTEEISNIINDFFNTITSDSIPFFKATNGIHRINLSIKYVLKAIDGLGTREFSCKLSDSYQDDIKRLRILLTDTPITDGTISSIMPEISIKDNLISLSSARQIQVEQELEELKNKVFMLQIEINRFQ